MATTSTRSPRRKAAAKPATPASPAQSFDASGLPETGTTQLRLHGDYKPHLRALARFARTSDGVAVGHVKALTHLGWVRPGGHNTASKSAAFTVADNADLSDECWAVGSPAGPQIAANLRALAELGAPVEAVQGLWSAYAGV